MVCRPFDSIDAFMSNWTIDMKDCTLADFDIFLGISAGRCSSFRHLTYITLNMTAHQQTWIHTHITVYTIAHSCTTLSSTHVRMLSVLIAPDISRIEFRDNADVLYKPIIQLVVSSPLGSKGKVMSHFLTTWKKAKERDRARGWAIFMGFGVPSWCSGGPAHTMRNSKSGSAQ